MIKKIFSFTDGKGQPLDIKTKKWLAQVMGGAVIADGIIHPNERVHLEHLYELLKDEPVALLAFREVVRMETPPPIAAIEVAPEVAEMIFKYVLEICASDHELQPLEIRYINEAGMALDMDILRVHKLINLTQRRVKIEFFNHLLEDLHDEERHWLAAVILKAIYADGRVAASEIPYLNDVYELVNGDKKLMEELKSQARNTAIEDLPSIYFDPELARKILRYLAELIMGDGDIDAEELKFIRQIAQLMHYEADDLEEIMDNVEQVKFFMHASSEL